MKKRWISILIIVVMLVGGTLGFRQWQMNRQASRNSAFQTEIVTRGELVATVGGTGTVHANQTAVLVWQTSGTVEAVLVEVGDLVSEGEELARLKRDSLPQNVILAQAELTEAQKALDELYTNAEMAKTNAMQAIARYANAVRDAQYQLDNFTVPSNQAGLDAIQALDLMKKNLDAAREAFEAVKYRPLEDALRKELKEKLDVAQSDYNAAVRRVELEYSLQVAQANLEKARQDYERWKNGPSAEDIAAIEARIAAAQATLNLARLTAPFGGTITEVKIKPGDQVTPGMVAIRIDDLSRLLVDVRISEVDINRVRPGQEATLNFDAILNKVYRGKVREVSPVGTIAQGIVDFIVTIELSNADQDVKPGMTAAVNIVVNRLSDVLLVPNRAVRLNEGERIVYVLRNGQPEVVPITLGASSETHSEVIGGELKVGDAVILNPPTVFEQDGPPPWVNPER
ncbi:MAG: efflux RND transporter periplasmic adaptor subunit [Anaerolineales bacterium]|nr:efflux RND transporter periplasmic adaptor subunit [Anaerolineales bacterium]MDW8161321.1 efflux RND transporter periplasmic adaptor subunit [Anaerolineales bacterium]